MAISAITVAVEFLAGTEIKDCVIEAKQKAINWGVAYICFDFNGTSFSIGANADVNSVVEEWSADKKPKYGIVAN